MAELFEVACTDPIFGSHLGVRTIQVHDRSRCAGQFCCIHNPSDHRMRDWPQLYRADRLIMERTCPHGVGHPDPDDCCPSPVHGCDGCCLPG